MEKLDPVYLGELEIQGRKMAGRPGRGKEGRLQELHGRGLDLLEAAGTACGWLILPFSTVNTEGEMTAFCLNTNFIIPGFIIKMLQFGVCVYYINKVVTLILTIFQTRVSKGILFTRFKAMEQSFHTIAL